VLERSFFVLISTNEVAGAEVLFRFKPFWTEDGEDGAGRLEDAGFAKSDFFGCSDD
jgi:hypothetical protein